MKRENGNSHERPFRLDRILQGARRCALGVVVVVECAGSWIGPTCSDESEWKVRVFRVLS